MAQRAIDVALDRASEVPLGTQLAWKLQAAIAGRRLRPGDRLPGVRELAASAGVNVNTVRAVYARLADQGAIVSEHGRGTFVAEKALPDDLIGLAERTAREARRAGVDPREVAALLFAGSPVANDVAARRALRDDIEALELERAEVERELAAMDEVVAAEAHVPVEQPPLAPRLLSTTELEAVRDDLAEKVAALRTRLGATRDPPRANQGVATTAPETVVDAGGWTLRWRL